jgi:hypothetical protein
MAEITDSRTLFVMPDKKAIEASVERGRQQADADRLQDAVDRLQRGMAEHQPATVTMFHSPNVGWTVEIRGGDNPLAAYFEVSTDLGTALAGALDGVGWR